VRAVDTACVLFALWTLACHAASFLGGSLWAAMVGFGGLAFAALVWRLSSAGRTAPSPPVPPSVGGSDARLGPRGVAAALGLLAAVLLQHQPVALWWVSVALLGGAVLLCLSERPAGPEVAGSQQWERALWALSLVSVGVALVSQRIDLDDSFYVNLAVAAADAPSLPVLAGDTLHGVPGLPLHLAVYKLHSWELWNAALARLSGLPAIACFHIVSAALAAGLAPLALARLLRLLAPRFWIQAVAATFWVLLVSADTHRWYANFGLVRIWQGKAVMLLVFLPLVQAYAIAFARRPSVRGFLLLVAGQVAALGATSTALWVGPVSALAAAACAVPISRRGLLHLMLVGVSSVYVLGVGLAVKAEFDAERRAARSLETSETVIAETRRKQLERHAPGVQIEAALDSVTGDGPLRAVAWAALLVTWTALPAGVGRRFAIGVPLTVIALLLNPYWSRFLAENLIGPSGWRAFWALPIPALLGLLLASPLAWVGRRRAWGYGAVVLAAVTFALVIPRQATLSEANSVVLRAPGLKVPQEAYALAEIFAEAVEPGAFVVAPPVVSIWLPTFHDRVYPLVVRDIYLKPYERQLGEKELRWRVLMSLYAQGQIEDASAHAWFREGLNHFDVRAVFLWLTPGVERSRQILESNGFRPYRKDPEWEIWVRS
jgi:hypothetical protein